MWSLAAEMGYAVIAFDQPGHGWSPGTRVRVESCQDWANNAEDFIFYLLGDDKDRIINPVNYSDEEFKFVVTDNKELNEKTFDPETLRRLRGTGSDDKPPLFIIGHSFGGLAQCFLLPRLQENIELAPFNRFKGTIFFAPCLEADRPPDWVCKAMLTKKINPKIVFVLLFSIN